MGDRGITFAGADLDQLPHDATVQARIDEDCAELMLGFLSW